MSTIERKQDFPIAFAEHVDNHSASTTEFYVEWLENSSEFPGLSSTTVDEHNLTSGNWELLQRKDILEDDDIHILVPAEEEEWSKLNTIEKEELYSKIIEKNAQELQPKQYVVQPLWTNESKLNKKVSGAITDDEDEDYEDDLGSELIDAQKSQSRRASKLSNRRRFHQFKNIDVHFKGFYNIATREGVQPPTEASNRIMNYIGSAGKSDKAKTLILCSKYTHNMKKRTFKYLALNIKKPSQQELSEYTVHSKITEKF